MPHTYQYRVNEERSKLAMSVSLLSGRDYEDLHLADVFSDVPTIMSTRCYRTAFKIFLLIKSAPLQAWSGPEGSRKLRFPDYMTMAQDGGRVVSLTHRPPLSPRNAPGTHFCKRPSQPQSRSAIGRILCQ